MQPTITVTTDASWRKWHGYGYGAWACYIRTPDRTIKTGGVIKHDVKGSTHAERYGLANALHLLAKSVDLKQYRVIVYCDNLKALQTSGFVKVTPKSKHYAHQKEQQDFYDEHIGRYVEQCRLFETRHVKGHVAREDWHPTSKRNYMNDWCDQYAKGLLRAHILQLAAQRKHDTITIQ